MCQKYVKKAYMEMGEQLYLEPWKGAPGCSILHYYRPMALRHYRSILRRKSINILTSHDCFLQEIPVLECHFNYEFCEILKSTYFQEHLRMAASENVFIKLRKIISYFQKFIHKAKEKKLFPSERPGEIFFRRCGR